MNAFYSKSLQIWQSAPEKLGAQLQERLVELVIIHAPEFRQGFLKQGSESIYRSKFIYRKIAF